MVFAEVPKPAAQELKILEDAASTNPMNRLKLHFSHMHYITKLTPLCSAIQTGVHAHACTLFPTLCILPTASLTQLLEQPRLPLQPRPDNLLYCLQEERCRGAFPPAAVFFAVAPSDFIRMCMVTHQMSYQSQVPPTIREVLKVLDDAPAADRQNALCVFLRAMCAAVLGTRVSC